MAGAVAERDTRTAARWFARVVVCLALVLLLRPSLLGQQFGTVLVSPRTIRIEFAALITLAVALAIALVGMLIRARALAKLMAELQRTKDLAAHREHERDL